MEVQQVVKVGGKGRRATTVTGAGRGLAAARSLEEKKGLRAGVENGVRLEKADDLDE